MDLTLDPIEKAIRAAFEKGDASDRAYRERVYRSAFSALDRAMQANPNITEAMMQRRRQEVSAKISEIESEFIPAVPAVEPARVTAAAAAPTPVVERREPQVSAAPVIEPRDRASAPVTQSQPEAAVPAPSRRDRAQKTRRSWISPLIALLVFAAIIGGGWWFVSSGGLGSRTTTASQSTPSTQPVQPLPMREPDNAPTVGTASDLADWISVFDPADPTTVSAPGDSSASVDEQEGQRFIRIASGASGSPILFDVGQGVLEEMSGRKVVFAITARAADADTQMSVECSLSTLGDCGRRRFPVGETKDEFLFEIDLPDGSPGSGGVISINPDIDEGGKAVDIFAIRVTPAGPAG